MEILPDWVLSHPVVKFTRVINPGSAAH